MQFDIGEIKCLCNLVEQWKPPHTNINLKDHSDVSHLLFLFLLPILIFPENYIRNSWGCTIKDYIFTHQILFLHERLVVTLAPTKNAALCAVSNLHVAWLKYYITQAHQYII